MSNDDKKSKLSVTNRDYLSIFNDLKEAIPDVSGIWDSNSESDPGIVLVKLMSMLGDMLSYNFDKQSLEVYPETVTQRKNAGRIFNLIGYKMRWFRSAISEVTLSNINPAPATVPRFTTFTTGDESITYTNVVQLELPSNTANQGLEYTVDLVQGIPRTPSKIANETIPIPGEAWHTIYNYNVQSRNIIDNRLYLEDQNIDENNIFLVDKFGEEWTHVDSIDILSSTGKYYELAIDEYDRPYLNLVSYWDKFNSNEFKLFYIVSLGEKGQITHNALSKVTSSIVTVSGTHTNLETSDVSGDIYITNRASSFGYNPETPSEARVESTKYINTYNTLVTLDDFTRAVSRMIGVDKCIALDQTNDPGSDLDNYEVKIYIVRSPEYESMDDDSYEEIIKTNIAQYKLMPLKIIIDLHSIKFAYWTVKGKIYLKEPVSIDRAQDILVRVNNQLTFDYSAKKRDFNSTLKFIDVIHSIEDTDPLIDYVDIDPIEYTDENNVVMSNKDVTGNRVKTIPPNTSGDYLYNFKLDYSPITPGSLVIRIDNSTYILTDNKNGKVINSQGFLNETGTIDYKTGTVEFSAAIEPIDDLIVEYHSNNIVMTKYVTLNTNDFIIASESIKR